MTTALDCWVIYERPRDRPMDEAPFLGRRWRYQEHGFVPTEEIVVADTLDEVRQAVKPGRVCFARNEFDDPVIVETWI